MASNEAYNDIHRYEPRASYSKDASSAYLKDNRCKNSEKELFANCVRIEPLSATARKAYLSGIMAAYDSVKMAFQEAMDPDAFKPFYAIVAPEQIKTFSLSFESTWDPVRGGDLGSVVSNMSQNPLFSAALGSSLGYSIGSTIGGDNGRNLGMATGAVGAGILTGIQNAVMRLSDGNAKISNNSMLYSLYDKLDTGNTVFNSIIGKSNNGNDIYGMNNEGVGASTMKRFSNPSMRMGKQLTFTWYMPEQEDLFRLSIRRLLKLAYVRNLNDSDTDLSVRFKKAASVAQRQAFIEMGELAGQITNVGENATGVWSNLGSVKDQGMALAGEVFPNVTNEAGNLVETANGVFTDIGNTVANAPKKYLNDVKTMSDNLKDGSEYGDKELNGFFESTSNLIGSLITTLNQTDRFFGMKNVAIPFPVRLTIGNIVDIEPLVITNVTITPSQETFVNRIGAHIPVTMNAAVTFDTWLTPDPGSSFVKLLGDDIFRINGYKGE